VARQFVAKPNQNPEQIARDQIAALDAPTVTGFGAQAPCFEELVLPKSAESGNLSLNKAVIGGCRVNIS
jgi:hypothetical protein